MAMFMVMSKHEPEQCMQALDDILDKGTLEKFVYGCRDGDHTGYAIIDALNEKEALSLVPDSQADLTCISKVDKFTRDEIESLHTKAA